jgi:hypothetical protein
MVRTSILVLVASVLWLASLGVWAQTRRDPTALTTTPPEVISGENIGVRVTGLPDRNGKIPGMLVVKINGRWVDVASTPSVVPTAK